MKREPEAKPDVVVEANFDLGFNLSPGEWRCTLVKKVRCFAFTESLEGKIFHPREK